MLLAGIAIHLVSGQHVHERIVSGLNASSIKLLKKILEDFVDFHNTAKAFHMKLTLTCEFTMMIWKSFCEYLWLSPFTKCDLILENPPCMHFPEFQNVQI